MYPSVSKAAQVVQEQIKLEHFTQNASAVTCALPFAASSIQWTVCSANCKQNTTHLHTQVFLHWWAYRVFSPLPFSPTQIHFTQGGAPSVDFVFNDSDFQPLCGSGSTERRLVRLKAGLQHTSINDVEP